MASRMLFPAARRSAVGFSAQQQRTFQSSAAVFGQKESHNHPDSNVDPEKHKQDLLSKQKQGKGHWKPELASDSEEAIKADRTSSGSTAEDVKNLQERTKATAEETSKSGTSMRDGL